MMWGSGPPSIVKSSWSKVLKKLRLLLILRAFSTCLLSDVIGPLCTESADGQTKWVHCGFLWGPARTQAVKTTNPSYAVPGTVHCRMNRYP